MPEIDADADGQRAMSIFQKDARQFLAVGQHIIGPFEGDTRMRREGRRHVGGGNGGDKGKLRPFAFAAPWLQQQRSSKIVMGRFPVPSPPAPAGGLAPRRQPQRPLLACQRQAACLFIGGIDFVEALEAVARRPARQGKRTLAAMSALEMIGDAATMKNRVTTPEITRIALLPSAMLPSKAAAGSSKYITFTMRK